MNSVGVVIFEIDFTSGPGAGLDHPTAFVYQSFIKVRKGTEKEASNIDIRRGIESAPLASLSQGVMYFLN